MKINSCFSHLYESKPLSFWFDALVLQGNFAVPLCDALVEALGEAAARRIAVFAFDNAPALPETRLSVTWHGLDLAATLDSLVDWCDAIHAGAPSPLSPVLAMF